MTRLCVLAIACMIPAFASADVVDVRMQDEVDAMLEAKRDVDEQPNEKRDDKKFDQANERRQKRRQEALDKRRRENAKKSHVYRLTRTVAMPGPTRPFDLSRDLNRGGAMAAGFGSRASVTSVRRSGRAAAGVNTRSATIRSLKILFLIGGDVTASGRKVAYLREQSHVVVAPPLPPADFIASVQTAEFAFRQLQPNVIVGDARGAAVAMNMTSGGTPLVLMAPAWQSWGSVTRVKPNTIILHSPDDQTIPLAASEQLRTRSGLPATSLVRVGTDHALIDPGSLRVMLQASQRLAVQ